MPLYAVYVTSSDLSGNSDTYGPVAYVDKAGKHFLDGTLNYAFYSLSFLPVKKEDPITVLTDIKQAIGKGKYR